MSVTPGGRSGVDVSGAPSSPLRQVKILIAVLVPLLALVVLAWIGIVFWLYRALFQTPAPVADPATARADNVAPDRLVKAYDAVDDPIDQLVPVSNGPGLMVCDPVTQDPSLESFAVGCGRWLHLEAAGQPELDRTPLLDSVARAVQEMGRSNLALSANQAVALARITGATDAAVGTLSGSPGHLKLTYRIWDLRLREPLGSPIAAAGTETGLLRALPAMAVQMDQQLGVAHAMVSSSVPTTPGEMTVVGQHWWPERLRIDPTDVSVLQSLAARMPLAGILLLTSGAGQFSGEDLASRLYDQAHGNTLLLATLAAYMPQVPPEQQAAVDALLRKNPNNYLLNLCRVVQYRRKASARGFSDLPIPLPEERQAAEHLVESAFQNPEAWLTLAWTASDEAQAVRHGVYVSKMTETQLRFVQRIYPDWVTAARHATELDPQYGKAWLRLATAASFDSDDATADAAYWKAIRYYGRYADVYDWGLEMYQPKWFDDSQKLERVAHLAAGASYADAHEEEDAFNLLQEEGYPSLADALQHRLTQQYRTEISRHPSDLAAWNSLGRLLYDAGRYDDAAAAFRQILKLAPGDPKAAQELKGTLEQKAIRSGAPPPNV